MSDQVLDYPRLVQQALLNVVREALRGVSAQGLPAGHALYLSFRTGTEGVVLSQRLRKQHPDEMTIVLEHVFSDLAVDEHKLAVTLRFGGTPEHVVVPFAALTAFVDPPAKFGLRFDDAATRVADEAARSDQAARNTPAAAATRGPEPATAPASGAVGQDQPKAVSRPARERGRRKVVDLAAFRKTAADGDGEGPRR